MQGVRSLMDESLLFFLCSIFCLVKQLRSYGERNYKKVVRGTEGDVVMAKGEQTSEKAGKAASRVLKDKRTGKDSKTSAGSALTQRPNKGSGKKK